MQDWVRKEKRGNGELSSAEFQMIDKDSPPQERGW